MATTIQVSEKLKKALTERKSFDKESYEDIMWDLLEDSMELSKQTKQEIREARQEIKKGKFKTLSQVKEELGL